MITQQQVTTKQIDIIGAQFAIAQNERSPACDVLKRRIDTRNEDLASQLEVERRDVTTVVVLGYN